MRRSGWLLGLGGASFAVLCVAARFGIGVSTDSVVYIAEARQLVAGEGLTLPTGLLEIYADVDPARDVGPSAHFPPLYPVVIAATGLAHAHSSSFRWLNALLLAATAVLVAVMVERYTRSRGAACLAAGMVVLSPPVLRVHSMAWSEPLYVTVGLAGLLALAVFLEDRRRLMLVAGAYGLGLAWLTRYVGIAFVVTGAVVLLLRRGPGRVSRRQALAFVGLSMLPMALFLAAVASTGGGGGGFTLVLGGPHPAEVRASLEALRDWFLPTRPTSIWHVLAWIPLAVLVYLQLRLAPEGREEVEPGADRSLAHAPLVLGVFLATSAVALLVSLSVFANYLPVEERYVVPLYVAAVALVACGATRVVQEGRRLREPLLMAMAALITSTAVGGASTLARGIQGYPGFAARQWREAAAMREVRALPESTRVYSNYPEAIYIATGREARLLPKQRLPADRTPKHLAARMARLTDDVRNGSGVVVYFTHAYRDLLPRPTELTSLLGVQPRVDVPDALLYEAGAPP